MKKVTITIEEYVFEFYKKIGETAGGIRPEQVMGDALFKLAGKLSLGYATEKGIVNNSADK